MRLSDKLNRLLLSEIAKEQLTLSKIEFLLQSGADSCATIDGKTIVIYAALKNDATLIRLMLNYQANPNASDENKVSLLMVACALNNHSMVDSVIQAGADVNAVDALNLNALAYLCSPGWKNPESREVIVNQISIFDLLLRNGLNPYHHANPAFSMIDAITPPMRNYLHNNPNIQIPAATMQLAANDAMFNEHNISP